MLRIAGQFLFMYINVTMPNMGSMESKSKNNNQEINAELKSSVEKFSNYLKIEDKPEKSDTIFILGGSSPAPIEKALELYNAGYSPKIAFISTGGNFGGEKVWNMPENEYYKKILIAGGVPEDAIVTEGKTTNTLAEAKAAIPFLKEKGINPEKIILVARPIHQRRAFATFSQQHKDVKYINCPANEPLDLDDPETLSRLVGEAERLLDYSKKDDIAKQEIPYDVLRAAVKIRNELKDRGVYIARNKPTKK